MSNDLMREQFERWMHGRHPRACELNRAGEYQWLEDRISFIAWQAAYRAGMERAANLCQEYADYVGSETTFAARAAEDCIEAIRIEIEELKGGDANATPAD